MDLEKFAEVSSANTAKALEYVERLAKLEDDVDLEVIVLDVLQEEYASVIAHHILIKLQSRTYMITDTINHLSGSNSLVERHLKKELSRYRELISVFKTVVKMVQSYLKDERLAETKAKEAVNSVKSESDKEE